MYRKNKATGKDQKLLPGKQEEFEGKYPFDPAEHLLLQRCPDVQVEGAAGIHTCKQVGKRKKKPGGPEYGTLPVWKFNVLHLSSLLKSYPSEIKQKSTTMLRTDKLPGIYEFHQHDSN